jgi:hypothetical protein
VSDPWVRRDPVDLLDEALDRHADAEREPAVARRLHGLGLHRQRDRVARVDRHRRGADLDAGHLAGGDRGDRDGVVVEALREPGRGEAGLGELPDLVDQGLDGVGLGGQSGVVGGQGDADPHGRFSVRGVGRVSQRNLTRSIY